MQITIGSKLKDYRIKNDMTQIAFAKQLKISRFHLSELENNKIGVNYVLLERFSKATNMPLEYFVDCNYVNYDKVLEYPLKGLKELINTFIDIKAIDEEGNMDCLTKAYLLHRLNVDIGLMLESSKNPLLTQGERVKNARKQINHSRYEFAKLIDVDTNLLRSIEHNEVALSIKIALRLSFITGYSISWFLSGDEETYYLNTLYNAIKKYIDGGFIFDCKHIDLGIRNNLIDILMYEINKMVIKKAA